MRLSLVLLFTSFLFSSAANAAMGLVNRVSDLEGPESAFYDSQCKAVFVSTMGPGPLNQETLRPMDGGDAIAKNGKGAVSVLHPDGSLWAKNLLKGLNSPKGVFVHMGRFLLVAEKDSLTVAKITCRDGVLPHIDDAYRFPVFARGENGNIRGPQLLNDIAVNPTNGDIFVTDTFGERIYRISLLFRLPNAPGLPPAGASTEEFVRGIHLLSPNGITYFAGRFWVVGTDTFTGYGNMTAPFRTQRGLIPADPEKPAPALPPNMDPNVTDDPLDPRLIPDPKQQDIRDPRRMINPTHSFFRAHHGRLYSLDPVTKKIEIMPFPDGGFDGVAALENGWVLVGDFGNGQIIWVNPAVVAQSPSAPLLKIQAAKNGGNNPADFSINTKDRLIYVPNVTGGEVQTYSLAE